MRSFSTDPRFDKIFKRLDKPAQEMIFKKMQKIVEIPELGKPMHSPLQNHFSERAWKYRIIYQYGPGHVTFIYIDHRDHVFEKAH